MPNGESGPGALEVRIKEQDEVLAQASRLRETGRPARLRHLLAAGRGERGADRSFSRWLILEFAVRAARGGGRRGGRSRRAGGNSPIPRGSACGSRPTAPARTGSSSRRWSERRDRTTLQRGDRRRIGGGIGPRDQHHVANGDQKDEQERQQARERSWLRRAQLRPAPRSRRKARRYWRSRRGAGFRQPLRQAEKGKRP